MSRLGRNDFVLELESAINLAEWEDTRGCRGCGSTSRVEFLSFGDMPLVDALVAPEQQTERRFPLTVMFCQNCSLVQIRESVDPRVLFCEDYPYYSSFSDAWMAHCRSSAQELIERRSLDASSLVLEVACNDGYMLRHFQECGVGVLGVDPAGPVEVARQLEIPVVQDFFTHELARQLQAAGQSADVIIANNVLAHVPDLPGFVAGIGEVLKADGVAVIECPYIRDLIEQCQFDTIYHEHHCYFSVTALQKLFSQAGLVLSDVRRLPTHGGSLRLYVEHQAKPSENVIGLLAEERRLGLDRAEYYADFATRVRKVQSTLRILLHDLRENGRRVAAYAAAAKGATLLNSCQIGRELVEYVVDRNPHKQGKLMPGVRVPIRDPACLLEDRPDFCLILAWNLADEIAHQQRAYAEAGGRFVVPIPEPALWKPR